VTVDVEAGNAAIKNNTLQQLMQSRLQELKPEAAYFFADHGKRTAYFFFDLKDTSQLPSIAEPFFQNLHATVEFIPVMNADDLRTGLEKAGRAQHVVA
jgi:hypothetical protein